MLGVMLRRSKNLLAVRGLAASRSTLATSIRSQTNVTSTGAPISVPLMHMHMPSSKPSTAPPTSSILSRKMKSSPLNTNASLARAFKRYYQQSQSNVNPDPIASERREKGEHRRHFKWFKYFTPSTLIGSVLAILAIEFILSSLHDPAITRPLTFWRRVFPIYINYRLVQVTFDMREKVTKFIQENPESLVGFLLSPFALGDDGEEERAAAYDALNELYAPLVLDIICSLRGYYVKLGQLGSLRSDFLPPQWIAELEKLQSDAPYADFDTVMALLAAGLERDPSEIFADIEPVPLGAASIGQVHKATLHDGRVVVVKLQYPDVEETFKTDMRTVRSFCELAQPEQLPFLAEVERQFMTEFDFERECDHLERIAKNMQKSPYKRDVVVPLPLREYCSRSVITMDYLPGVKLVDALRDVYRRIAADQGVTLEEFMIAHRNEVPPSSFTVRLYSALFAASDAVSNAARLVFNWTAGWFVQPMGYKKRQAPIDIRTLIDTLVSVHAYQAIHDGYFNGDPHPGNILFLEDGRLGLIDFGQVKALNLCHRAILSHLMLALKDNDERRVARLYQVMGHRTKHNSTEVLFAIARLGFDYDDLESRGGTNIEQFFEALNERDPVTVAGDDWVMASRLSLLLRGLASALHYPVKISHYFAPICQQYLRAHPALDSWVEEYVRMMEEIDNKKLYGTLAEAEILEIMSLKGEMLLRKADK